MTRTVVGDPIRIEFPAPAPLLNWNQRHHWAKRAQLVRAWRTAAFYAAKGAAIPAQGRTLVTLTLPVHSLNIRRDPSNFSMTTKAAVDGLVDAGVWPDDTGEYVVTAEPEFRQCKTGLHLVWLTLQPIEAT